MLNLIRYGYKRAKPRVVNQTLQQLAKFRKQTTAARRRIHRQAYQQQNQEEDQYLERHKDMMKEKHHKNQCKFRGVVAKQSYQLAMKLEKFKEQHQQKLQKLEKYVHQEQIKKMNRERIKKIMEYESTNFWLTPTDVREKLTNQVILPDFIGTTEYYHKLYAEALAYQNLDFDMLHKMSNTQQMTTEKNKILMPLYRDIIILIKELKTNQYQKLKNSYEVSQKQYTVIYAGNDALREEKMKELEENHQGQIEHLLKRYQSEQVKRDYLESRLNLWVELLKKWSEYTQVLNMTSVEIRKLMQDQTLESKIELEKNKLKKSIKSAKNKQFVDPVEEDTDDDETTLEDFIKKSTQTSRINAKVGIEQKTESASQVDMLLNQQEIYFDEISGQIKETQKKMEEEANTYASRFQNMDGIDERHENSKDDLGVDERLLHFGETTTSIELLKQQYKDDEKMIKLLDLTGEIVIDYPGLFKKVWDEQTL